MNPAGFAVIPVDFRVLRKRCEGLLGWSRIEFWEATLEDVTIALDGYEMQLQDRLEVASIHATWIINGVASAYRAKTFKRYEATQLYDRTKASVKKVPLTKEQRQAEADDFLSKFPKTLDPKKIPEYKPR